jgi:pimeloyl-ACP methyl ester carboxylesterase
MLPSQAKERNPGTPPRQEVEPANMELVQDHKGRWVSPLEPALADVAPDPMTEEVLLGAVGIDPPRPEAAAAPSLPPHSSVSAPGGDIPPLQYGLFMGFDAVELGAVARALPREPECAAATQKALDSALQVKAEEDDPEAVTQLLAAGASATAGRMPFEPQKGAWETGGRTALHLACYKGALKAVVALLEGGADRAQLDDCGNTAFDVACEGARGGQATSKPAMIATREQAALLVAAPGAPVQLPDAVAVATKLKADRTLAREIGPRRMLEQRQERGNLLRRELERRDGGGLPESGGSLLFSTARDCRWDHHWYAHAARSAKASSGQLLCVLPWAELATAAELEGKSAADTAADRAAGGWKARLLAAQLPTVSATAAAGGRGGGAVEEQLPVVVVGHSSGGTAALRMAERLPAPRPELTLIVIGAGHTADDYAADKLAREQAAAAGVVVDPATMDFVIPPWEFDKICANVGKVVVMHGKDDDVVSAEEATKIATGLQEAAAAAAAAAAGGGAAAVVQLKLEEAGFGHAMEKLCPPAVLSEILAHVGLGGKD